MESPDYRNLLEMVEAAVRRYPDSIVMRDPLHGGSYQTYTYTQMWQDVKAVAQRLHEHGVTKGDRVGLISDNRAWWLICDLAVMSLGAWTVPVYPSLPASQAAFILKQAEVRGVIVENQPQLAKLLETGTEGLPSIEFVTVCEGDVPAADVHCAKGYGWAFHRYFDWVAAGTSWSDEVFRDHFTLLTRADVASIIYTSGTTGLPKGAMLTHGNLLGNVEGILPIVPIYHEDEGLSYLPLCHIFERTASQWITLYTGGRITYSKGIDAIIEEFVQVRPTVFTTVPRLLEKVHEAVMHKMTHGPGFQKRLFDRALALGERAHVQKLSVNRTALWLYDRLVYRKIRALFGGRVRLIVCGGAPLPPHVFRFLTAMGMTVVEGYGLTETSPVIAVNSSSSPQIGVVGKVLHNVEAQIASDGELLVRGVSISPGYFLNEEATSQAFADGWFHTGDIAQFTDDGYLKITDRKKNLLILSTGKNVAPAPIESAILASPYIDQVLLVGHGRKFVSAIVVPSEMALKQVGLAAGAAPNAALESLLLQAVQSQSTEFARFEQPKAILVRMEPFTVDNGLLTPTLKIRAADVLRRYESEIDGLYESATRKGAS